MGCCSSSGKKNGDQVQRSMRVCFAPQIESISLHFAQELKSESKSKIEATDEERYWTCLRWCYCR
jgi:hypothetical protein